MSAGPQAAAAGPDTSQGSGFAGAWDRYWFSAVPVERVDVFARIVAVTVVFTTLVTDRWAAAHGSAPHEFHRPVALARWLSLPPPSPRTMDVLVAVIVVAGLWALTRRAPRASFAVLGAGYGLWLLWAFSWSKVDHDRLTITVALLVLALTPRVGASAERWGGWALRTVQVVFVLAYPFSAYAKIRFGGWEWMSSATFARAVVRRGTFLGDLVLNPPALLVLAQWAFVAFEVATVVLLFPDAPRRLRNLAIVGVVLLHGMTFAMIGISFLPHTVCLTAFFPLERLSRSWRRRNLAGSGVGGHQTR